MAGEMTLESMIGIAESAVDRYGPVADEAEFFVLGHDGSAVSAEKDRLVRSTGAHEFGIGVRVVKDGRLGFSFCTTEAGLGKAMDAAVGLSRSGIEVLNLFRSRPVERVAGLHDPAIESIEIEELASLTSDLISRSKSLDPDAVVVGSGVSASVEDVAMANTAGASLGFRSTYLSGGIHVMIPGDPPATGYDSHTSRKYEIDPQDMVETAVDLAQRSRDPVKGEPGLKDIVLHHGPFCSILEFTMFKGLVGSRASKGNSVFSGKVGTEVGAEILNITDVQTMPGGCGSSPFDDEGTPSRELKIVENGVLMNLLHNLSSAEECGAETTGSAVRAERYGSSRSYRTPPGASAQNVYVEGTVDDAISQVDEGVYIVAVMGAHTSNPASGDFSLNTNIAFKIEHGEISSALKPMMLSGNIMDVLTKTVAVGSDHHFHFGQMTPLGGYIPSAVVSGLNLTV